MGLDITFYKQSKLDSRYHEEIGYFRKVNFILTYFNVEDNANCEDVYITKEQFEQFIVDLNTEIKNVSFDSEDNLLGDPPIPTNEKLKTKSVFFGGSTEYGECYWYNIRRVRNWAQEAIKKIDWDKDDLCIVAWW